MDKGILFRALLALSVLFFYSGCSGENRDEKVKTSGRLSVVATLFPLYDFARIIAGDHADVALLLPPGTEPHSFEPRPGDMARLNRADIFVYTNRFMEPWAEDLLRSAGSNRLSVVDAGSGAKFIAAVAGHPEGERGSHSHGSGREKSGGMDAHGGKDPHIWLDFSNAAVMADNILRVLIVRDPANSDSYRKNAEALKAKLSDLDSSYQKGLAGCRNRIIVNGGHYTFGYLAERYGLKYIASSGFSPDAEPSAGELADITKTVRMHGLKYIFYEELLSPRTAETVSKETGATLLKLHGAHNISKDELTANRTFIELMKQNLDSLMTGLQCR